MRKHLSRMLVAASMAVAVVAGSVSPSLVRAQAANSTVNNANTLKISPIRSDVSVAPGKSGVVTVKVTNLSSAPMTVQPIENDFVAGDERGTPALILDANKYAPTHSLKRYMAPLQNVTIPAKSDMEVKIRINVPTDAKPGGYFGAVRFQPVTADTGKSVNLDTSAASLILMTVPGDAVEKLDLTDFQVQQGGKSGTWFQSPNDLQVTARFQNGGSVQEGPYGNVTVKQGDKVVYTYEFNTDQPREMVLPDSARRWDVPLKNIGAFGNYTVTATFTYGNKNESINVTKSFWVIPMYVIIVAVAGTLVLIGLIVGIWLFLRGYKRRILRSNHRGGGGYRR